MNDIARATEGGAPRWGVIMQICRKTGAGEGIRTLDPNLGNFEIPVRYDSI